MEMEKEHCERSSKTHLYRGYFILTTKRCFRKGCQLYAAHVEEPFDTKGQSLEYFSVLQEFEDVFQEILILPPRREIDFSIDLVPGATSVSKTPYIISTPELKESQM
jgi:hypothetical protein